MSVSKILQDVEQEPNSLTQRINQLVELQESREQVNHKLIIYQHKMKSLFNKKENDIHLQPWYLVLRWDVIRECKGKHRTFDPLWFDPFKIVEAKGNNTFLLENLEGEALELPVNGNFLKLYFQH